MGTTSVAREDIGDGREGREGNCEGVRAADRGVEGGRGTNGVEGVLTDGVPAPPPPAATAAASDEGNCGREAANGDAEGRTTEDRPAITPLPWAVLLTPPAPPTADTDAGVGVVGCALEPTTGTNW